MSGNSGFNTPESSREEAAAEQGRALDRMAANARHLNVPAPAPAGVRVPRVNVDDPTQAPSEPLSCRVSKDLGFAEGVLLGLAMLDHAAGRSHTAIDDALTALSRVRDEIKASEAPDA